MTKTPNEIKKGLECCRTGDFGRHSNCPYNITEPNCMQRMLADALAYIQQLEADNAQQARCIENLTDKLNAAHDETAKLQTETGKYEEAANKCCYESQCNAELNHMEALCKRLKDENEQLQTERDAAVEALKKGDVCEACKHFGTLMDEEPCAWCSRLHSNFEWRGVQKEH